jgi:hypothetical protein
MHTFLKQLLYLVLLKMRVARLCQLIEHDSTRKERNAPSTLWRTTLRRVHTHISDQAMSANQSSSVPMRGDTTTVMPSNTNAGS